MKSLYVHLKKLFEGNSKTVINMGWRVKYIVKIKIPKTLALILSSKTGGGSKFGKKNVYQRARFI